jgi:hypothetical protein
MRIPQIITQMPQNINNANLRNSFAIRSIIRMCPICSGAAEGKTYIRIFRRFALYFYEGQDIS